MSVADASPSVLAELFQATTAAVLSGGVCRDLTDREVPPSSVAVLAWRLRPADSAELRKTLGDLRNASVTPRILLLIFRSPAGGPEGDLAIEPEVLAGLSSLAGWEPGETRSDPDKPGRHVLPLRRKVNTVNVQDEIASSSGLEDLLKRAEEAYEREDMAAAYALFRRAAELAPKSWKALQGLGVLAFHLGDRKDAWELFREALILQPDNEDNVSNFLDVAQVMGRRDEAHAFLAGLAARHPTIDRLGSWRRSVEAPPVAVRESDSLCDTAEEHLRASRWLESLPVFLRALNARPDLGRAWNGLGIACFRSGWSRIGGVLFETAVAHDPTDEDSVLNLAQSWLVHQGAESLACRLRELGVAENLVNKALTSMST